MRSQPVPQFGGERRAGLLVQPPVVVQDKRSVPQVKKVRIGDGLLAGWRDRRKRDGQAAYEHQPGHSFRDRGGSNDIASVRPSDNHDRHPNVSDHLAHVSNVVEEPSRS